MAKLDTYQKLVVDAINEYGTGDWKNWISVHYVHESGYSNIICHSEIIVKVFYDKRKLDLNRKEYQEIIMDNTRKAPVTYIAFMNRAGAEESFNETQITRYRNMLRKQGFLVINVDKKSHKDGASYKSSLVELFLLSNILKGLILTLFFESSSNKSNL